MNNDTLKGNIKMFTGQVKKQWGKLTGDDLVEIEGRIDLLIGKVQERYGVVKAEAAKQVNAWAKKIEEGSKKLKEGSNA